MFKPRKKKRIIKLGLPKNKFLQRAMLTALLRLESVLKEKNRGKDFLLEREQGSALWYFYVLQETKIKKDIKKIALILQKKKVHALQKVLKETRPLDPRFFKPWKYEIPFLTERQIWLKNSYRVYKTLSLKDRTDFFQTQIGQMLVAAFFSFPVGDCLQRISAAHENRSRESYQFAVTKIYNIMARASLPYFQELARHEISLPSSKESCVSRKKTYAELNTRTQMSWFYENTLRTPSSITFSKFKLTKFATAFHSNYHEVKKRPWIEPLFFKRAALSSFEERYRKMNKFTEKNFQYKFYLRNKNPRHIKRNRLFKRRTKLLSNTWTRQRIVARKIARIKQIVGKLLRPFYGHLTLKQWTALIKKNKRKKTKYQARTENILQHLENRLDVTVYRLNWAPSVMWARRLIRGGFIFVTSTRKMGGWNQMYSSLKKYSFPLKLRDPQKLYCTTFWKPEKKKSKHKFFYLPQKKVSYLIQTGDLLQCSRAIFMHQFKNNTALLQKPISSRFLLGKRYAKKNWRWDRHQLIEKDFNSFEFYTDHRKSAFVLSKIKSNNLPKSDRANKKFLRWVIT